MYHIGVSIAMFDYRKVLFVFLHKCGHVVNWSEFALHHFSPQCGASSFLLTWTLKTTIFLVETNLPNPIWHSF